MGNDKGDALGFYTPGRCPEDELSFFGLMQLSLLDLDDLDELRQLQKSFW
jgi:hypothetical protein